MKGLRLWLVLLLLASCTVWGGQSESNRGSTKTKNKRKKKSRKGGDKNKGKGGGGGDLSGITMVEAENSEKGVNKGGKVANGDKGSVCFVIASLPWTFGPYQTQGHELSKQLHARGYKVHWWAFTLSVPEGRYKSPTLLLTSEALLCSTPLML
jgi:hypothetical protein